MKPCATCIEKAIKCTYDSQYLRGRPPTPPASTIEPEPCGRSTEEVPPPCDVIPDAIDGCRSLSRGSPELDTAEISGQYVDRSSGLAFLQRARTRLKQANGTDRSTINGIGQPLAAAGDKPLLGPSSDGLAISPVILPSIPHDLEAKELLDLYFDVCVATYKPLHRPTVDAWYQSVAGNVLRGLPLTEGIGNAKVSALMSVFAVATFHRQKFRGFSDDVASLSSSDAFFRCSMAFTETETGVPHLESAQARLLQVFYLLMTCRMNRAWYIFGSLLQIISALGMHRRARRAVLPNGSQPNYIHGQCKIRTFWSAYILDKYLGVVLGRPRHFHDKDIDQDYPDRVEDDEMTPAGPNYSSGNDPGDCHLDGFIWNIRLAHIVNEISDGLYGIKPMSEAQRIAVAQELAAKLDEWQASLPALFRARPSSLARGFRRQCVALRLAHKHALVHLYRPFLLNRSREAVGLPGDSNGPQRFRQESIRHCITAARDALQTIDTLAQEGPLFHAFWWTHYITFCALSVTYVWDVQRVSKTDNLLGIDTAALMQLAERCQIHLAQATATNSPSRRYSIILEELRGEVRGQGTSVPPPISHDPTAEMGSVDLPHQRANAVNSGQDPLVTHDLSAGIVDSNIYDPFLDWQVSDWLELDASAYGAITGLSPDLQWLAEQP